MNGIIKKKDSKRRLEQLTDVFLKDLFTAILNVEDNYYAYSTKHLNGSYQQQEQLERVFAYELYHQWSKLLERYNKKNKNDKRVINGEVGKKLDFCNVFPDMILHKGQEDIHNQEIAIEIKRKISLSEENLLNDLEKLSDMLTEGKLSDCATPFKYSVFILIGGNESDITRILKQEKINNINDNIFCVFCQKKGELAFKTMDEIKAQIA